MRLYIATGYNNWAEHNRVRNILMAHGHTLTFDWTLRRDNPMGLAEAGECALDGILRADTVVVLLAGARGTYAEIGIAIGKRKRLLIVGTTEDFRPDAYGCPFYHTTTVRRFLSVEDMLHSAFGVIF